MVVIDRNCHMLVWRFVTVLLCHAGNGHNHFLPCRKWACQVVVTIVAMWLATLFQEQGIYCHAIIAMARTVLFHEIGMN